MAALNTTPTTPTDPIPTPTTATTLTTDNLKEAAPTTPVASASSSHKKRLYQDDEDDDDDDDKTSTFDDDEEGTEPSKRLKLADLDKSQPMLLLFITRVDAGLDVDQQVTKFYALPVAMLTSAEKEALQAWQQRHDPFVDLSLPTTKPKLPTPPKPEATEDQKTRYQKRLQDHEKCLQQYEKDLILDQLVAQVEALVARSSQLSPSDFVGLHVADTLVMTTFSG